MFIVFGRIRITQPYSHWHKAFKAHAPARQALGIEDVMCAPVVGSQHVIYVVKTANPRLVHDMSWAPGAREVIEAAGHVLGEEVYTVCEVLDE